MEEESREKRTQNHGSHAWLWGFLYIPSIFFNLLMQCSKLVLIQLPFFFVSLSMPTEINRVRSNLFQINGCEKKPLVLPDAEGQVLPRSEKVYVPVKEFPEVSLLSSQPLANLMNGTKESRLLHHSVVTCCAFFFLQTTVQLCWTYTWSPWHDGEATWARDRLQDHGPWSWLDEGQEEGNLLCLCTFRR